MFKLKLKRDENFLINGIPKLKIETPHSHINYMTGLSDARAYVHFQDRESLDVYQWDEDFNAWEFVKTI